MKTLTQVVQNLIKPYIDRKVQVNTISSSDLFVENEYVEATLLSAKKNCNVVDLFFDLSCLQTISSSTDIGAIFGEDYQIIGTFVALNDSTITLQISQSDVTFSKNISIGTNIKFHITTIL